VIYCFDETLKQQLSAAVLQDLLLRKQLKMEGFLVSRWQDSWDEGINQNLQWIKEVVTKTSILVSNVANLNESSHCAQCSCIKKTKHSVQQLYFKKNITFM